VEQLKEISVGTSNERARTDLSVCAPPAPDPSKQADDIPDHADSLVTRIDWSTYNTRVIFVSMWSVVDHPDAEVEHK
jgi:hypothetical protein